MNTVTHENTLLHYFERGRWSLVKEFQDLQLESVSFPYSKPICPRGELSKLSSGLFFILRVILPDRDLVAVFRPLLDTRDSVALPLPVVLVDLLASFLSFVGLCLRRHSIDHLFVNINLMRKTSKFKYKKTNLPESSSKNWVGSYGTLLDIILSTSDGFVFLQT